MMNTRTLSCLLVVLCAGTCFGLNIGYIGSLNAYYSRLSNCTTADQGLCKWISNTAGVGSCTWEKTITLPNGTHLTLPGCQFTEGNGTCSSHNDQSGCAGDDSCVWDDTDKVCNHNWGFTASQNGLVATMMIAGAFVISFFAGKVVDRFGLKMSLGLASAINVVATALHMGAWAVENFTVRFALLLVARFISGISLGISTVAAPMYVGDVAQAHVATVLGVLFQVFCTFGIFVVAAIAWGIAPAPAPAETTVSDRHSMQIIHSVMIAVAALMAFVSWWVVSPESVTDTMIVSTTSASFNRKRPSGSESPTADDYLRRDSDHLISPHEREHGGIVDDPEEEDKPIYLRPKYFFFAILFGMSPQLSSINAIMSFAPQIAKDVGIGDNAFFANMIIMLINFVTTIASIWLAQKMDVRWSFLFGTAACGLACICVAVPSFPGVVGDASVRNALIATGFVLVVAIFEIFVGPSFFHLNQRSFPPKIRSAGTALTLSGNFCSNIAVNYGYPVAVSALSGGASGNQRKGLSIMFMIFGAASLIVPGILYLTMQAQGVMVATDTSQQQQLPDESPAKLPSDVGASTTISALSSNLSNSNAQVGGGGAYHNNSQNNNNSSNSVGGAATSTGNLNRKWLQASFQLPLRRTCKHVF